MKPLISHFINISASHHRK